MKHLFVSYQVAKALKQLGFDEPCLAWHGFNSVNTNFELAPCNDRVSNDEYPNFTTVTNIYFRSLEKQFPNYLGQCSAPTHQQVVDWFREKHNYSIEIQYKRSIKSFFALIYPMYPRTEVRFVQSKGKDYYTVLNAAIDEAIKLIQK